MRISILPYLALISLTVVSLARAQQRTPKDPQSTFEPRSEPGSGQKFLAQFVGDWEVAKTFYSRTGEVVRSKGECRQTMIHDGKFLKSEFVFEQKGAKTTGTGIIGFEPASGRFTSIWVDSRRTEMSMRQSKDPFKGDEIVLYSVAFSEDQKKARPTRTLTRLEDNGRKIVHRQYAPTPDGKERLMMELILTRKTL